MFLMTMIFFLLRPYFSYYRNQRKQVWIDSSRHVIKMLMTKTEILVNNKTEKMLSSFIDLRDREKKVKHGESYFSE